MKEFCITYKEKTNTPSRSGVMPSEWFEAHSREDVPPMLYAKLKVTKGVRQEIPDC